MAKRDASVEDDQVFRRGPAALTGHEFVFDLLPFVESRQSSPFDTAEMSMKASLEPSLGAMKPYPFVGLNHFTLLSTLWAANLATRLVACRL